jgi:hypothetical protein
MSEPNAISAVAAPSAAEIDDGTRPDIDRCLRLFRSSAEWPSFLLRAPTSAH